MVDVRGLKRLCVTADTRDDRASGAKDEEQGGRASTGCGGWEGTQQLRLAVDGGHPQVRGPGVKYDPEP